MLNRGEKIISRLVNLKSMCTVLKEETGLDYHVHEYSSSPIIDIMLDNFLLEQDTNPGRLCDYIHGIIHAYRHIQKMVFKPVIKGE